jgi:hypothetical protein
MHNYSELIIGNWYKSTEIQDVFEIVAIDEEDDCIEIQYFSGEIAELDLDSWNNLNLTAIDPPEDWTGAYEMNKEDLEEYDEVIRPEDWDGPLTFLDKGNEVDEN